LSEVYLVELITLRPEETEGELDVRLLRQANLRPQRVDQVYWIGKDDFQSRPGGPYRQTWAEQEGLAHLLLQQAARTVLAGDAHIVLVGETGKGAVLLASPEAVGVYNLMPHAVIGDRLAAPDGADFAAIFQRKKIDLNEISFVFPAELSEQRTAAIMAVMAAVELASGSPVNLWGALQALLGKPHEEGRKKSVLASNWQGGSLLTVLEMI